MEYQAKKVLAVVLGRDGVINEELDCEHKIEDFILPWGSVPSVLIENNCLRLQSGVIQRNVTEHMLVQSHLILIGEKLSDIRVACTIGVGTTCFVCSGLALPHEAILYAEQCRPYFLAAARCTKNEIRSSRSS